MKKYIKIIISAVLLLFTGVMLFTFITYEKDNGYSKSGQNVIMLNDITKYSEKNWNIFTDPDDDRADSKDGTYDREAFDVLLQKINDYGTDFCILNDAGEILYDSRADNEKTGERLSVEYAVRNNYPYKYVIRDGKVAGAVILIDNGMGRLDAARLKLMIGTGLCGLLLIASMFFFFIYVERNIVVPFKKMEDFAGKVAEGNLNEPIAMDKGNLFGAFSESFDIMREELAESKKRELALQKKERELVASLSHDLKTPITGIKLTTELLQAKLAKRNDAFRNEEDGENAEKNMCSKDIKNITAEISFEELQGIVDKLGTIYQKADQIDVLVSDLFAATLDDLGEFRVSLKDEKSTVLDGIIKKYDDRSLVKQETIPEVIISTDVRRMSQVIGNIISNSYKYAGTDIDISYKVTDGYLKMEIRDHGPGVPESEIDLITNKFYRGKDWKDSKEEGSGLGLYISKTLMMKMNGELITENKDKGLSITLLIPLS